ncbi:uncharacterized protein LY89DRAFT_717066 [Mollisia scopiformis]|uniref:Uncharacterized protein n=1 Tax=Mollisia scopiformis TaxID=149040 RepID=A0A194XHF5_MOLSC|nr:uncharacterized protein LY89DRAFT_717066 [Mollisia scopiformis]KUJ19593.1 hypothetical protein LY89DRAFT_717066 [Mollisia scopiformis]
MGFSALTRRTLSRKPLNLRSYRKPPAYFQSRRAKSSQKNTSNHNEPLPSANFRDLGASRTVKIVVFTFLAIAGTLEMITWTKLLWAKFGPSAEDDTVDSGSDTKK